MKKPIITLLIIAAVTAAFSLFVNAQTTLYVPSGTGGIGSSTGSPNTNVGIGTSTPSNYLAGTNGLTLFGTYPGLAFARSAKTWLFYVNSDNSFRLWESTGVNAGLDRITVLQGGNVGLGTTAPTAKLQVQNGAVLFDGTLTGAGTTPASGAGTRMMWIPAKAAFRAGFVTGTEWNDANIGGYSFASGQNTIANGPWSFATGMQTTASGWSSFAAGNQTNAIGLVSSAFGALTTAQSFCSFVLGQYNYNPGTYNTTSWVATDALFVIGNGTSESAKSNAVTVLKNGNTGIGVSNPDGILHLVKPAGSTANYVFRADASGTTPPFIIDAGGNVGIGLTVSSSKLEIRGNTNTSLSSSLNVRNNIGNSILKVRDDGKVTVGVVPDNKLVGNYNLYVKDGILAGRCRIADIATADWSDFVFEKNYDLMPLYEVEKFVKKNKHLPDVPSATEVSKTGIDVAKMDALLLQKIEELTLYTIDLQKQVDELKKQK